MGIKKLSKSPANISTILPINANTISLYKGTKEPVIKIGMYILRVVNTTNASNLANDLLKGRRKVYLPHFLPTKAAVESPKANAQAPRPKYR